MVNDLPIQFLHDEMERNAFNAAFYELGFRWHWDSDTYCQLRQQSANVADRIRHYLETRQPHLLKAYDASFLVQVIQDKAALHRGRGSSATGHFDWAQAPGGELGA